MESENNGQVELDGECPGYRSTGSEDAVLDWIIGECSSDAGSGSSRQHGATGEVCVETEGSMQSESES